MRQLRFHSLPGAVQAAVEAAAARVEARLVALALVPVQALAQELVQALQAQGRRLAACRLAFGRCRVVPLWQAHLSQPLRALQR